MYYKILLAFLCFSNCFGQYNHIDVFPNLNDDALFNALHTNYKPGQVLNYSEARDVMYSQIYLENDSVRGIYSDYALYLSPIGDPSDNLYMNGDKNGINTEHVYPQSKGAKFGNARSDMHHLFPAKTSVNEERSSLAFAEINDNLTLKWFYKKVVKNNVPSSSVIDNFSEKHTKTWEPREQVKGDVARAMFYFYTMYKDQADEADPSYFSSQQSTLCQWHFQDPVDSLEWVRNYQKAAFQDNKVNPFILDCSLARLYCSDIAPACVKVPTQDTETDETILFPNPVHETLSVQASGISVATISVVSINNGRTFDLPIISQDHEILLLNTARLSRGIYLLSFKKEQNSEKIFRFKFVK